MVTKVLFADLVSNYFHIRTPSADAKSETWVISELDMFVRPFDRLVRPDIISEQSTTNAFYESLEKKIPKSPPLVDSFTTAKSAITT